MTVRVFPAPVASLAASSLTFSMPLSAIVPKNLSTANFAPDGDFAG